MLGRDEKRGGVLVSKSFKFCGNYKIQSLWKIHSLVCRSLLGVHNVHAMYMNVLAKITKTKSFILTSDAQIGHMVMNIINNTKR